MKSGIATVVFLISIAPTIALSQSVLPVASRCAQPATGSQIVPTFKFPAISPQQRAPALQNPLRPGVNGPLTMLTIGDSAMWGNGLKVESKYARKVAQDLANATGRTVNLVTYAHSGADLSNESKGGYEPLIPSDNNTPPGDLNAGLPTTLQQEACAAQNGYADAELVLIDGCINDIGAERIALPFPLSGLSVSDVKLLTHQWCSDKMLSLLNYAKSDFPYATIVVANYWLIVSDKSSPIGIAMQRGDRPHATLEERAAYLEVKSLFDKEIEAEEATGELKTGRDERLNPKAVFQQWGDNSKAFLDTSQQCFEWAIASVNRKTDAPNGSDACPKVATDAPARVNADARAFLATVPTNPEYSYGAGSKKRVWSVPLGPHWRVDQLYRQRSVLCYNHYTAGELGERLICRINPTAHPNIAGAKAYAQSIAALLKVGWAS